MACFRTPGEAGRRGVPLRMSVFLLCARVRACVRDSAHAHALLESGRRAGEVICNKSLITRRVNWLCSLPVAELREVDNQRRKRRRTRAGIERDDGSALASY